MSKDRRIRTNSDEVRASRTEEENIAASDKEVLLSGKDGGDRMFMDEFNFEALPDPNKSGDPNFHYFWATTTNSQDTPHRRIRMGYVPVNSEERPEFKHLRLKAGEFEGVISMNEMVLMKIPMAVYQKYMMEIHHHRPNDEESKLKAQAKLGHVDKAGRPIDVDLKEDEGYREMGKFRRAPDKFE